MNNNDNKSCASTSINWYPGHMAKTKRQIEEDLKLVDIIIEILDSRIPISSQNPDMEKLIKNKDKIIVLNKCDLANKTQNELWVNHFKENGIVAILADCNSGKGVSEILKAVESLQIKKRQYYESKGRVGRKIKAMVIGIPNVGKSSFINRVSKSSNLEVGNKPGVTKKKQWIRINDKIELLDTPGVLWPKFENEKIALNLAFTGTIKDEVLQETEIAYELLKFLIKNYKKEVLDRYDFKEIEIDNILSETEQENLNIYHIMQLIGKKRGCIISGGQVDDEKTSRIILDDFRSGKIGKITIETC